MKILVLGSVALAACFIASPAFAQTEGPIVSALVKPGQTVDVIDDQGQEIHGKVRTYVVDDPDTGPQRLGDGDSTGSDRADCAAQ